MSAIAQRREQVPVLLVDDLPANLVALEAMLADMDLHVVKATSGADALRCLINEDFALILLDVKMPGIGGHETAALIRGRDRSRATPIIFLTAYGREDNEIMRGYVVGAADVMVKPLVPEILRYKVQVFADLYRRTAEVKQQGVLHEVERLKREFLTNVSHELRTPLTLIAMPIQLLQQRKFGPLTEEQGRIVDLVKRNGQKLLGLIDDLLDFSRVDAGAEELWLRPTDVGAFLGLLASPFESAFAHRGLAFSVTLPPAPISIALDRQKLDKVLSNLLSNALKFTEQGSVTLELRETPSHVVFEVRDTGPGIGEADLPHLFQRFRQVRATARKQIGSGIGLALARSLTELHGGSISVQSRVGVGSTFRVTVPNRRAGTPEPLDAADLRRNRPTLIAPASPASALAPLAGGETRAGSRVVIVEDDPDLREMLCCVVSEDHHRVSGWPNGRAALTHLRAEGADVIVSDVMMPVMDGFELCRIVKADNGLRQIPIIVLAAAPGNERMIEALDLGADDYLSKPCDPAVLRSKVRAMLRHGTIRDELIDAARLSASGRMAERYGHEINDGVQAIVGLVHKLRGDGGLGGVEVVEDLDGVERCCRRITEACGALAPT